MPPRRRHGRAASVSISVPPRPVSVLAQKRKCDKWLPLLSSAVTSFNRKKRRLALDLLRSGHKEHVVCAPLPDDWMGFPAAFVDSLKASYPGRSYHGAPDYQCAHCGAVFWFEECVKSATSTTKRRYVYNLCCKGGKVHVPDFTTPPAVLADLLHFDGDRRTKKFLAKIRLYNCLFAFTSMGANIDRSATNSRGPPIFKICGAVHHRMGSLTRKEGNPKFCELYIYDTTNEVRNRIDALSKDDKHGHDLDPTIVAALIDMLNVCNPLVQTYRMAKERLVGNEDEHVAIRILAPSPGDSPQFSLPTTSELAALVVGEFTADTPSRDIVVDNKTDGLQQISFLHPAFMPLQYPLLFPYAERGFQLDVPHIGSSAVARKKMTMQEYYCFVCHYRPDRPNPYLCYGLLSSQAVVDSRACIDENRLWYILKNQDDLRSEHLQGITDAIGQGSVDGSDIGKRTILPSSHTGGRRYFVENFQDGLAICRVHGAPDLFSTFTCNPKWPEITEALLREPGQQPCDRADIVVRVYALKLDEYIDDIRAGRIFGPVKAVLYTVEFQKRGLPHAHILIWQDVDKDRQSLFDVLLFTRRLDKAISLVMPISTLAEVNRTSKYWTVCAYVSRLWHHRGGTDNGPIKHTDMVLIDVQGNHIYAEIPADCVPKFMNVIEEGKIYELSRFMVYEKKTNFRPVEAPWMIKFGRYTIVQERLNVQEEFPFCTFSLTPITDLPNPNDLPIRFTDVAGIVTGVSEATQYHSASRADPSTKRIVYLSDHSGHQISIVLWGERAIAFEGDWVLQTSTESPVIAIFVGTLVKNYEGRRGLSGSAACRWYINEDLPEINAIHARLNDKIPGVEAISLPNQTAAEISAQVDLETKTVGELLDLDIWRHEHTKFFCTATILRLSPSQRWWFFSCSSCYKSAIPYGAAYRCSDPGCGGTQAAPRYRLCYIGGDGQDEIEFIFFDRVGKELIGKPLLTILRAGHSSSTPLEDIVNSVRGDGSIPRELAGIVSTKYRFVVQVTSKSFESESSKPSFQVHRIDTDFGKQSHSSALRHKPAAELASSSRSATSLSFLMPGASTGERSPPSGVSTVHALSALDGLGDTNPAYIMSAATSPPSVSKLPSLRKNNVLAASTVRKALVLPDDHEARTGQVFLNDSGVVPTLPADGTTLKGSLSSPDPSVLDVGSHAIEGLESASGKLEADKTSGEELPVSKGLEEESLSCTDEPLPAATVPSGPSIELRRKAPRAAAGNLSKKNKT